MSFCPLYSYHAPPSVSYPFWVAALGAVLTLCIVGGVSVMRKSRDHVQDGRQSRDRELIYDLTMLGTVGLFAAFFLWVVIQSHSSRLRFERSISDESLIETIEGRVSNIERIMAPPSATSRTYRREYWIYSSITLGDKVFQLGRGSPNPGFRHYDYFSPPIIEGDLIRISHYRGRASKIENECDVLQSRTPPR